MAHPNCRGPGQGPVLGTMGFCIMLCTVHTTQGQRTIVIACKRSLGQGNVFTPVCDSVHGREGLPRGGGVCLGGVCIWWGSTSRGSAGGEGGGGSASRGSGGGLRIQGLCLGRGSASWGGCPPRRNRESGWYALYWNVFLFSIVSVPVPCSVYEPLELYSPRHQRPE